MNKTKFKLDRSGVRQLLKSSEMQTILHDKGKQALQRLGSGYDTDIYVGKNRANSTVYAESYSAKLENSRNNSILKAVK